MDDQQLEEQPTPLPDVIEVDDLNKFVQILSTWHSEQCAVVQHMLTVPEGITFEVGGESLVLEGAALTGFKFGIEMAMMQLGKLPFEAEVETNDAQG